MQQKGLQYKFKAKCWQYTGSTAGWHFVSLPVNMSYDIRQILKNEEKGWGRLKAIARVGSTEWETAIWFDTKANTYLLPLKAEIRRKENIFPNSVVEAIIWI